MSYQQPQPPNVPWQGNVPLLQPRKRAIWPWIVLVTALVGAIAVIVVVLFAGGGPNEAENSELEYIRHDCGLSSSYASIGDNGHTLTLDGQGKDDGGGLSWSELECTLNGTKMPASARGQFNNTRALDGMQSASWDGYSATWNYHPSSGVNLVITTTR